MSLSNSKIFGLGVIIFVYQIAVASRSLYVPVAPAALNFNSSNFNNVAGCEITNISTSNQTISLRSLKGPVQAHTLTPSNGEINDPPRMPISNLLLKPNETYTMQFSNIAVPEYINGIPKTIIITVAENKGMLVGSCYFQYIYSPNLHPDNLMYFPMNNGRPF